MPVPQAVQMRNLGYPCGKRRDHLTSKFDLLFEDSFKEWIGFKPAIGLTVYPCYACRHLFASKSSLQDHVNRRVLILKYICLNYCEQELIFYNRCTLLLHIRSHYGNADTYQINLEDVSTAPLPIALAGFLPHPEVPCMYDGYESFQREPNTLINALFYTPELTERGKKIIDLKAEHLVFKENGEELTLMQVCLDIPRCEFVTVEYHRKRKEHYIATAREQERGTREKQNNIEELYIKEEPSDDDAVCQQPMTLPVITKVETLQKMVKLPRCLECGSCQSGTMAEHYLGDNKPCDYLLRCSTCKFIASTKCSLKAHIRIHQKLPPYVCPECGRDFTSLDTLKEHMSGVCFHMAKNVRYRCPGKKCGKLFATSATFAIHFKNHLTHTLICAICGGVFNTTDDVNEHRKQHQEQGENACTFESRHHCFLCPEIEAIDNSDYLEHINMHTSDPYRCIYVYMCKLCRSYFRSTATYATHLLRCSGRQVSHQSGKKPQRPQYITKNCAGCENKIIYSSDKIVKFCSMCKAAQADLGRSPAKAPAKPVTKRYYCVLCKNQILVEDKVRHMRTCKYAHPLVLIKRLSFRDLQKHTYPSTSRDEFSSPPFKRRSKSESPNKDEQKRRRKTNRLKPKTETEPDLTADEPVMFDGTYYCKLCSFKDNSRSEFHEHIKSHRDISTAYQCMECGECFVVKPSLMKHLMHFHNISDCESYLKDNDCFDVEAVKELEETIKLGPTDSNEPLKENQCRVCREEFKDSTSLNKHFRIHGMAFLLRNSK